MSQNGKLNFGIIGYGHAGRIHAKVIETLDRANLVAVSDLGEASRAEAKSRYPQAKVFVDYQEMLQDRDIDAVSVCLPTYLHHPAVMDAAAAGKQVLLEKPLAMNVQQADEMIEACESAGLTFGVIFQRRFEPVFQALRGAVEEGKFGKLAMAEISKKWYRSLKYFQATDWRSRKDRAGGKAVLGNGIHHIDLLQWLMGKPESLFGYADTLVHDVEVDDVSVSAIRFENGALATVEMSVATYAPQNDRLELHGSTGSVVIQGREITEWKFEGDDRGPQDFVSRNDVGGTGGQGLPIHDAADDLSAVPGFFEAVRKNIDDFTVAVLDGGSPLVTGAEARKSLEIAQAIYLSAERKQPVTFPLQAV